MDELKAVCTIPAEHQLSLVDSKWAVRKGQDTDTEEYEERNQEGVLVAKYTVRDSTSTYPPFGRSVRYEKFSPDGILLESGNLPG